MSIFLQTLRGWHYAWPEGTLARSLPKHVFLQPLELLQPNSIKCDVFPIAFLFIYSFTVENMGNAKSLGDEDERRTWSQPALVLCDPDFLTLLEPFYKIPGFSSRSSPASRSGADGFDTP